MIQAEVHLLAAFVTTTSLTSLFQANLGLSDQRAAIRPVLLLLKGLISWLHTLLRITPIPPGVWEVGAHLLP